MGTGPYPEHCKAVGMTWGFRHKKQRDGSTPPYKDIDTIDHCTNDHCTSDHCTSDHCTSDHCTSDHCTIVPTIVLTVSWCLGGVGVGKLVIALTTSSLSLEYHHSMYFSTNRVTGTTISDSALQQCSTQYDMIHSRPYVNDDVILVSSLTLTMATPDSQCKGE